MATQVSLNDGAVASAGALAIQTNGTTQAVSISTGQVATLAQNPILTSGTANGVAYLNGSKALTTGSALTFDGTGLAIGNASPLSAGKLSALADLSAVNGLVVRDSATTYANNNNYILLQNSAGATAGALTHPASASLGMWGNDDIRFFYGAGAAEAMRIASATGGVGAVGIGYTSLTSVGNNGLAVLGNVGIGTSSPGYKLDVSGYIRGLVNTASVGNASSMQLTQNGSGDAAISFLIGATTEWLAGVDNSDSDSFKINNITGGGDFNGTGITLTTGGKLLLGVTSGTGLSNGDFAMGNGNHIRFRNAANSAYISAFEFTSANGLNIGTGGSLSTITFGISGIGEAGRFDTSGNLLVGKTSSGQTINGIEISPKYGGTANNPVLSVVTGQTGGTPIILYSTTASAYRFYVEGTGQINATFTTITAISDQRLKENIRDLDDGLASVMALKPRKFDWKEGKGQDIKNARGFIAQEFENVFPDMISEWKDPAPEGEEPYKAINANLIPTLVKALQEMKTIIDQQAERIAALEAK